MTLDDIVSRQYEKARRDPGTIAREMLPKGLIVNVKLDGAQWHVQFLRLNKDGKQPKPQTKEWAAWEQEIRTCREAWRIPEHVLGKPIHNLNMYAFNFVFPAVAQKQLV